MKEMKAYGQIGYEAYRAHTGGKSLATGQEIPLWENLAPVIQEAWEAAGRAVAGAFYVDTFTAPSTPFFSTEGPK